MPRRVLFVCLGNACRSIMAEALARHFWQGDPQPASAGISPLGHLPEETLEALREIDVATSGLHSKALWGVDIETFDLIVNLTHYSLGQWLPARLAARVLDRYIEDPFGSGMDAYRRARGEISRMVKDELPARLGPGPAAP